MKKLILLLLFVGFSAVAETYTEWWVDPAGNNLFSGSTSNTTATFSADSGFFTNNTSASTCTYFLGGLNPVAGGVAAGMFASVYPATDTTNAVFIGRIDAADDTADTITINLTNAVGSVPASDTAGATSIRVGGAWKGPNTNDVVNAVSIKFPLTFITPYTMTNGTMITPCFNFRAGIYSVTNAITMAGAGFCRISGYTSTPRDGGRATLEGGTAVAAYGLMTINTPTILWTDFNFENDGADGTFGGPIANSVCVFRRCRFQHFGNNGLNISVAGGLADECEAYGCNRAGTSLKSAFLGGSGAIFRNCVSHDNTGSVNAHGFYAQSVATFINCLSYNNSGNGFLIGGPQLIMLNCDAYNNTLAGVNILSASVTENQIINCNFFKNGMGITNSSTGKPMGYIINCGFGTGTDTNGAGGLLPSLTTSIYTNSLLEYASPWTDAANGNFSQKSTSVARAGGRGSFMFYATNSPTVSYPDIGATQYPSTNAAAASGGSYTFAQ